ncbi:MAG: extracellular solute-binding protein, partial [Chloroflexi bacterium]|nr:extracellular solute-binding protein [Chloroflexota bacterium]
LDLTGDKWRGRAGWAPTNASFVSNVTAMRVLLGDCDTEDWLEAMIANDIQSYPKNTPIVKAVIDGEIVAGLVNHYYLFRFLAEDPDISATLHFFPDGDPGSLINVAGAAILESSDQPELALQFVEYMLSDSAQAYFASKTYEYPLVATVEPSVDLPSLEEIESPAIDLSDLDDLQGTLEMIEDSGALD